MKKFLLVLVAAMFVFACNSNNQPKDDSSDSSQEESSVKTEDAGNDNLYSIESGRLKIKMLVNGVNAVETKYFKDYGKIEHSCTEVEMMGEKMKNHTLRKDGYVYSYLDGSTQGIKFQYEDSGFNNDFNITEESVLKVGGKKLSTENVADKECTIYEIPNEGNPKMKTKIWVWKGIPLKIEGTEEGVGMEALEVEETGSFPSGTFDLPKNITFVDNSVKKPADNKSGDSDFDEDGAKG